MRRLFLLASLLWVTAASAAERFAVVVGNNEGGPRRARLWFAEKDAERFARALEELGDFPESHVLLLKGRPASEVKAALTSLEAAISDARKAGHQTVLVFYFSGHAGAGALELGQESIDFGELKALVEISSADVKVAIVDACESGALTQVKGAKPNAALDFPLPTDESARGVAYIASTAVGEVAQESAAIGGSFFTFHLETALRGAGDANGDGQVSLGEAFQYTSSRTATATSSTENGPQHPTYNMRMSGRGDVMLSDLRRAEANLALGGDARSSWVVSSGGRRIAEAAGGVTLALPSGTYRVEHHVGKETFGGELSLSKGQSASVGQLPKVETIASRNKGGDDEVPSTSVFVGGSLEMPLVSTLGAVPGVRVGVRQAIAGDWGVRLDLGYEDSGGRLGDGVTAFHVRSVALEGALLRRIFDRVVWIDLGLSGGGAWHEEALAGVSKTALSGNVAASVSLGWPLGRLVPQLQALGGARMYHLNDALVARPYFGATLALAMDF